MTLRAWSGITLAAALLAACSTTEPPKQPPPPPPVVGSPGHPTVKITEANAGASVTIDRGQTLVVSLPIRVTAGREWSLVDMKPGVLTLLGSSFERSSIFADDSEAGGTMMWRLKPEVAGSVKLSFELRRPRRLEPAVQTIVYDVTVK
ncbi:MAG: protease inhibitor I42 family protein [Burkholderiales bacterium]